MQSRAAFRAWEIRIRKPSMDAKAIRVLMVEDSEDDYRLIQRLCSKIQGHNFTLDWEAAYETALDDMVQGRHDVYLLDYRLGQRDGLQLLRDAMAQGCCAPVILLTAYGGYEVDLKAMQLGATDFLPKDGVTAELLERVIRYALAHKRVEDALRRSEERYRRLCELTSDFAYACRITSDGHLVREWLTDAFTRITGCAPEELDARGWKGLIYPDDLPVVLTRLEALRTGGVDVRELRLLTRSGEIRWDRAYTKPVPDEKSGDIWVYGAVQDITEQKSSEEALRASEKRLRALSIRQ